jgi:hypothetical protein
VTGLEGLVGALGETLAVFVVTLVVMIVTAMIIVVRTNVFLALEAMIVVLIALICKVANRVVVVLCHFVAEFTFGVELDFLTLLCE